MDSTTVEPRQRPAAPIDPRIRARRIEVQRQVGRRRLSRLVDVGLVLAVAAVFVGALWTPLLDVDEVRITGTERLDADAVARIAGLSVGDPLVRVDLAAVGRRLAAVPWVASVELHRGLDGVVSVEVVERTPVVVVGSGGDAVALDVEGRVLGPAADAPADLVAVAGITAVAPGAFVDADGLDALALAAHLQELAPGAVTSLDATSLVARLAVGGEVDFGDGRRAEAKARGLAALLEQVDLTCLARIDLSLPANAVLTREEGCS